EPPPGRSRQIDLHPPPRRGDRLPVEDDRERRMEDGRGAAGTREPCLPCLRLPLELVRLPGLGPEVAPAPETGGTRRLVACPEGVDDEPLPQYRRSVRQGLRRHRQVRSARQ